MKVFSRPAALASVLGMLFTFVPAPGHAGTGRIHDGRLDLSVLFLYPEGDPDAWKPVFDEASRLLYNATNGQLQLGAVRVYSCTSDFPDIDVWIQDNTSGAFANVQGLGATGHVYLSQVHRSTVDPTLGQFGLVHELGHYAFGLYDEYKGETEPAFLASRLAEQTQVHVPHQFCVTDLDTVACIMDGGSTVVPSNRRTEFCTGLDLGLTTTHNAGVVVDGTRYLNAQEFYNGESCWETIARIAGLDSPQVVDPTDPAGLAPVDWQVMNGLENMVLCIDRSASMYAPPGPISLSRSAALGIVDLLRAEKTLEENGGQQTIPGENLAVLSFAERSRVDFPLQPILDEDKRAEAREAVASGDPNAGGLEVSDLGGTLLAALDQLTSGSDVPACSESIVLLTDGGQNAGVSPLDVLPELVDRGVRVYAIGVGDEVDEDLLKTISTETHGEFYRLAQPEDLPGIFTAVAAAVRADGTTATYGDSLDGSGESLTILIDSFAEEVTAVLSWDEGILDLVLVTPTGERIDLGLAETREDIEAVRGDGFVYIRVVHPDEGEWVAEITPQDPETTSHYELTVLESDRSVSVTAHTDQEEYDFPAPVHLRVDVVAGVPVAGASVQATVERPSGPPLTVPLFDDGDPIHGDTWADDGVYNVIFAGYSASGVYTFHVEAVNVDGTGPDPTLPFVEDGNAPPLTIPPFVRETEISVLLRGAVVPAAGTVHVDPGTINVQNRNGTVTCRLELPAPLVVSEIDPATIRLNTSVAPRRAPVIGDADGNGVPDLTIKFDRGQVIDRLPLSMEAPVTLTGLLQSGQSFVAHDVVATFDPAANQEVTVPGPVVVGASTLLSWPASTVQPVVYDGYLSLDGGAAWTRLFAGVENAAFAWDVAVGPATSAKILVEVRSPERTVAQIESALFSIEGVPSGVSGPSVTRFLSVSPLPIQGSGIFRYALAAPAEVDLSIYDIGGRCLRRLVSAHEPAGLHAVPWDGTGVDGRRLSSGVYLYRFRAGAHRSEGRVLLAK